MTTKATRKRSIVPVKLTVQVEAKKINENGTFSSFEVVSVKGPNSTAKAVCPPQGGGSIYIKVESLDGLEILTDNSESAAPKKKLF